MDGKIRSVACTIICFNIFSKVGRDNVVSIAILYGLDSSGVESRWGTRFTIPVQIGPEDHPGTCEMGTDYISRG